MTIPEIQAALNDLGNQLDRIEKMAMNNAQDIQDLRRQIGVDRTPTDPEGNSCIPDGGGKVNQLRRF